MATAAKEKGRKAVDSKGAHRRRVFHRKLLEKRGVVSTAMIAAGYSENYALHNASAFKRTKAYAELLADAGLTREKMARYHDELTGMEEHDQIVFHATVSDGKIKKTIEAMHGCKLLIIQKYGDKKICYFKRPIMVARKAGLEMALKTTGDIKPSGIEDETPAAVMSDDDLMAAIMEEKKKLAK